MIEGSEYVRKTVEVVLTVSLFFKSFSNQIIMIFVGLIKDWSFLINQDTSEKKQVETYVWANKDDPNLYGEWDFEVWNLTSWMLCCFNGVLVKCVCGFW